MKNFLFLFTALAIFTSIACYSQVNRQSESKPFMLKGEVVDAETNMPIPKVNVEILGGQYTTTNLSGRFSISAKIGDELIIKSDDFITVYYTISKNDFITVRVEKAKAETEPVVSKSPKNNMQAGFKVYLDSAKYFLKKDAQKSIEYVTRALEPGQNKNLSKS